MKRGQVFEWLLVKSGYSVEPILKFFYLAPSGAFVGKCCFPGTTKKGNFSFLLQGQPRAANFPLSGNMPLPGIRVFSLLSDRVIGEIIVKSQE